MQILYFEDEKLSKMESHHLESLVSLVKEVWDKDATVERYLEARSINFEQNPFMKKGGYPIALLIDDENSDKVVGQCNSTPCRLWADNHEVDMYWNAGLHLLPDCRGKGLGMALPEKLTNRLPIVSGFFVVPQQLRTHQKLGFHIVGKIPDFIKLYRPGYFFQQFDFQEIGQVPDLAKKILGKSDSTIRTPFSWAFAAGVKAHQAVLKVTRPSSGKKIRFSFVDAFDSRIDELWDKVKHSIRFAQVRHSAYMNWQFKAKNGWKKLIMEEEGSVVGFALIAVRQNRKEDKLSNMKMVSTIDLVWDFSRNDILNQYFDFIDTYSKKQGADVAFCSINKPEAISCLKRFGYLKIPSSVYFVVKSQRKDIPLSGNMEEWFITRGDADAAGSMGVEE